MLFFFIAIFGVILTTTKIPEALKTHVNQYFIQFSIFTFTDFIGICVHRQGRDCQKNCDLPTQGFIFVLKVSPRLWQLHSVIWAFYNPSLFYSWGIGSGPKQQLELQSSHLSPWPKISKSDKEGCQPFLLEGFREVKYYLRSVSGAQHWSCKHFQCKCTFQVDA